MRNLNFSVTDEVAELKDRLAFQYKTKNKADLTWEMLMEIGVETMRERIEEQAA